MQQLLHQTAPVSPRLQFTGQVATMPQENSQLQQKRSVSANQPEVDVSFNKICSG